MVFDLWGITALTTIAPVAPVQSPAPATLNWAVEGTKILATGLVAFGAAYWGYKLANNTRRYEILYKERFKGFENVAAYAYSLRDAAKDFRMYLRVVTEDNPVKVLSFAESIADRALKIEEAKPNRINSVLLSQTSKDNFNKLLDAHFAFNIFLAAVGYKSRENPQGLTDAILQEKITTFRELFDDLEKNADALIESAFKDIDLPRK